MRPGEFFLKWLSGLWKSLDTCENNCNISCRPKILSSWTLFAVQVHGSDVNQESVS